MFRLISILLLLAGLALLGLGSYSYFGEPPLKTDERKAAPEASAEMEAFEAERSASEEAMLAMDGDFDGSFGPANARSHPMVERLRTVPIAHETPATARYNRSFEVTVAIDATGDDSAADALPGEGNIVEDEAGVLDKAQATLSGAAFDIQSISPLVQTVSPVSENVWRWKVTPLETGRQTLRIELFALDGNEAMPVRTFSDEVEVKVSRLGQVIATADQFDPLFMVLGGAGSLLAGLFGIARFFRGR